MKKRTFDINGNSLKIDKTIQNAKYCYETRWSKETKLV